jgi:hypothetical protein
VSFTGNEETKKSNESSKGSVNVATDHNLGTGYITGTPIPHVAYDKMISDIENGVKPDTDYVPPREDIGESTETGDGFSEINKDDYVNDKTYEKDLLVYYRGDRIVSTENGTVITNPAILIGTDWERLIGIYAPNTAFVRNNRLVTDYEIYVEEGSYTDEYGPLDYPGED